MELFAFFFFCVCLYPFSPFLSFHTCNSLPLFAFAQMSPFFVGLGFRPRGDRGWLERACARWRHDERDGDIWGLETAESVVDAMRRIGWLSKLIWRV
jgi:hypothetical protein